MTSRGSDHKRIFFNKTDYAKFKSYLEEIGKLINGLSYSAVSQIKKRFSDGPLKKQATKKKIKEMQEALVTVKG